MLAVPCPPPPAPLDSREPSPLHTCFCKLKSLVAPTCDAQERRTEQDRAQRASVLEDFDNRPVAFMEDDEQDAATRDQVPGLWRGTDLRNRSQEDIHAVDNKPGLWRMESLGQKPERSTGTTSVFNPDMRFGQPARSVVCSPLLPPPPLPPTPYAPHSSVLPLQLPNLHPPPPLQ